MKAKWRGRLRRGGGEEGEGEVERKAEEGRWRGE